MRILASSKGLGPSELPATFVDHNFKPGGRANYYMTGPDGERYAGWWEIIAIYEPNSLSLSTASPTTS